MARKKFTLPPLNLSVFTDASNIPVHIEKIIIEALIYYQMDIEKVCSHFSLKEDIPNAIAIKYYSQISAALENKLKMADLDNSLNDICNIFKKHVNEVKRAQNTSDNKSLRTVDLSNICKVADRLKEVRRLGTEVYKSTITDLAESILQTKISEVRVNGPLENDTDYKENQNTVLNMLSGFKYNNQDKMKAVLLIDKDTGETTEYKSFRELADVLNTTPEYVKKKIKMKTPYKEKYYIKVKEEDE